MIIYFDKILIKIRMLIIITGTIKFPLWFKQKFVLHVFNDSVAKLATFQQLSAFHQTFEVIGHGLSGDSAFHAFNNQVCGFEPLHVTQQ